MQFRGWCRTILQGSRLRPPELSAPALRRLEALEMWRRTGQLEDVCEVFGFSRASLYRWRQRLDPDDLKSLEAKSRRPHRVRQPQWTPELARAVERLRRQYPRWGKSKLVILLQREGVSTSASTVGRILAQLRHKGLLVDPPLRRRTEMIRKPRPWARRCPGGPPPPRRPGDLIQLDTLHISPLPGVRRWQFTARDVISRWDVVEVHRRATSQAAEVFLGTMRKRFPFRVRALQIDGGSEFKAFFEQACRRLRLPLFLLPPRSPKLNAYVERANGTHRQEFYECVADCPGEVVELNKRLLEWEHIYNHVRPHQALGYLTPAEYLNQHRRKGSRSHM